MPLILPVVFCGYKNWYVTFREEHKLGMFKIMVLRKILGLKKNSIRRSAAKSTY